MQMHTIVSISYALCYTSALFVFSALSLRLNGSQRLGYKLSNVAILAYVTGMFFGAHALFFPVIQQSFATHGTVFFRSLWNMRKFDPRTLLMLWQTFSDSTGGLWGGPAFSLLAIFVCAVVLRLPLEDKYRLLDHFAVSLAFALAVAKIGCFIYGCCYGVEGNGLFFIKSSWTSELTPCHMKYCFPSQLLDTAAYLLTGACLLLLHSNARRKGKLLLWFVLLFSVTRFLTEFTRGDHIGGKVVNLSPVQLVLVFSTPVAVLFLWRHDFFKRLLLLRHVEESSEALSTEHSDEILIQRLDKRLVVTILVVSAIAGLVLPVVLLLLFLFPLAYRLASWKRIRQDPVTLTRAWSSAIYFMLGALFFTTYLLDSVVWFYLTFIVCWPIMLFVLNAYVETPVAGFASRADVKQPAVTEQTRSAGA